jgi:hypothetical protein
MEVQNFKKNSPIDRANVVPPSTIKVVMVTNRQTCPFVTSNKVLVCQIKVNAMLTSNKVKLELLCPRWLTSHCHVVAMLDGWM